MNAASVPVTALILAGGRGRRLDGEDKGLLDIAGTPLISHVIERIRPQVEAIFISANRNLDRYHELADRVICDDPSIGEDYAGPMAGIVSALGQVNTDYLLVIPCDTPCLPGSLVAQLVAGLDSGGRIVIAHDGTRPQYLVMLLDRRLEAPLREWLQRGGRAVRDWLATQEYNTIHFDQEKQFINLNTVEDVARFAQFGCIDTP